jgi:hypothetical protein
VGIRPIALSRDVAEELKILLEWPQPAAGPLPADAPPSSSSSARPHRFKVIVLRSGAGNRLHDQPVPHNAPSVTLQMSPLDGIGALDVLLVVDLDDQEPANAQAASVLDCLRVGVLPRSVVQEILLVQDNIHQRIIAAQLVNDDDALEDVRAAAV